MMKLQDKIQQQSELARQLGKSLQIQDIWPDAYDSSQSVGLKGIQRQTLDKYNRRVLGFISARFSCRDGREYQLKKAELLSFKPDAVIHPEFKEPTT